MALGGDEKLIRDVLKIIKTCGAPIGAGSILRGLGGEGYGIAEATVGRLLRALDDKGCTEKKNNQGRTLSAAGEEYLRQLESAKEQY